jgi:hypothetical protein
MRRHVTANNGTRQRTLLREVENLWAALCLHFAYYIFCRLHQTLPVTPAMESGITDRVWSVADLLTV